MFQFKGVLPIALLVLFLVSNRVQAEIWELGYTKPVVEEIIENDTAASDPIESVNIEKSAADTNTAEVSESDLPQSTVTEKPVRQFTRIATAKNTFGVETIEQQKSSIYLSPYFGFSSVLGNSTVTINPQYSYGARAGYLLLDHLMIEGGYARNWMTVSAPVVPTLGYQPSDVFDYRQRTFDLGAKFFFLGRESRLRPFLYGGFAMTNATLSYSSNYGVLANNQGDFEINQFQGAGQLGLEFAFTRRIVATATFQLNGVLSHRATAPASASALVNTLESSRITAGNSLSHSAIYQGAIGLGVYF
jgi:hypothetical protein